MIIILVFIIVLFFSIFSYGKIKNIQKGKTEAETKLEILHKSKEEQANEIVQLLKKIEELKKENENIKECDNVLMTEKDIIKVFEELEKNNYPRLTKKNLARLWEVIPYYPPDWKLRKYVVRKRDNFQCKKCGIDLLEGGENEDFGEVHHIIPLSMGGTNEISNLIFLCHNCHKILHEEIYNFDFSKYDYQPIYGIEYLELFRLPIGNSKRFTKGNKVKLNELLQMPEYQPNEPNTDLYLIKKSSK